MFLLAALFLVPLSLSQAPASRVAAANVAAEHDDGALAQLRRYEERRRHLIARLEPCVCAVMSLKRPGGGSGVIISPQGWILTNYHVAGRNKVMKIGLPDGNFHLADVVGVDPGGDIAVCALRGKGPLADGAWPHCGLGDSDKLRIGGLAYAMGNPFLLASDFKPTVTVGIVSGVHRYQAGTGPNQRVLSYPDCIQVDAPINPGNSGGPLFDENGLLVGINGRITIRDRGRVNTGVGFAVSINQIKNFLPDLLAGEHAEHGTMSMNAWKMEDPNSGHGEGIFVQGLLDTSVAYKSGLQLGDMLTSFNGEPLRWTNDLAREVGVLPAGSEVTLGYRRWNESSKLYEPERHVRFLLAAIDTGSRADRRPNVPDFRERPDFKALRAKAAAKAARKKPAPKKPPKSTKSKPAVKKKKPVKRDLDREEALFHYMDGVVAAFRAQLAKCVGVVPEGGLRRVEVVATPASGKQSERKIVWQAQDGELRLEDGPRTFVLSRVEKSSNERSMLERMLALNPLLRPRRALALLKDAWLAGGVFIGSRVGYVLAIRGPGKRAIYLDRDRFFPIGYRYRSHYHGGLRDVRFTAFEHRGDRVCPTRAEVRLDGKLVERWQIQSCGDHAGFALAGSPPPVAPSAEVERRIAPLFKSVVKVFGASGIRGIPSYGTGLIVSDRGHVLTWSHASLLKATCRVVFEDGSVHAYQRRRQDPRLGVTLLEPAEPGKFLKPTERWPIRPIVLPKEPVDFAAGTPVLSIGNSFKLAEFSERVSVTFGVIVGKVRSDLRLNLRKFPFQGEVYIVDAPSNPGTHGGGLFTLDGKLVGLLTTLVESGETNTQLSLAVPAYELTAFVAAALGDREKARAIVRKARSKPAAVWTGIRLFNTGRKISPPAYIDRVLRNSPAARAKLRPDDLIVRVNEFPVRTCAEFWRALRSFGPGEKVDLTFKRGSSVRKVALTLEAKR